MRISRPKVRRKASLYKADVVIEAADIHHQCLRWGSVERCKNETAAEGGLDNVCSEYFTEHFLMHFENVTSKVPTPPLLCLGICRCAVAQLVD